LDDIASGKRAIGTLLPTEHELCALYSVSRATVRQALMLLQDQGLVTRSQGIGTRVLATSRRMEYVLSAQSANETMGYVEQTHFVTKQRRMIRANAALARALGVAEGSEWLHVNGLRVVAQQPAPPLAISNVYVVAAHADLLDQAHSAATPVFRMMEQVGGEHITEIGQDVTAVQLAPGQARSLRAPPGSSALHVLRRYLGKDGQVVQVTTNLHPADRFTYSLRLHPS
jgi:GntR family transcriptional regulator